MGGGLRYPLLSRDKNFRGLRDSVVRPDTGCGGPASDAVNSGKMTCTCK